MAGLAESLRASLSEAYRIERELGAGGMATVYLAEDLRRGRRVAIKVLRPELAAVLGADRFEREIRIAAGLVHPHILPLLDSGHSAGLPWYVMPFVEGEDLRGLLVRERQLAIGDALRIARQVADALHYAHGQGVIHRDIKPENILLEGGAAVVSDFGIARAVTESAPGEKLTRTGVSIGTPAYMSPEQAAGEEHLDGRSDIYSLGCVLYEMLAGETPFTGPSTQNIIARHQLDPVPPLRTVRPTVSVGVERAVLRALEKVPADRFTTAADFAAALARAATDSGHALTARPSAAGFRRRRRPLAWAAAIGAVALLGWAGIRAATSGIGFARGAADDTTRYAVIAIGDSGTVARDQPEEQLVRDALSRWEGIGVVPAFQVRRAAERRGLFGRAVRPSDLREVAHDAGAGRYVALYLTRSPRARIADAKLFDTGDEAPLKEAAERLPPTPEGSDSVLAALVDRLLLRIDTPLARAPPTATHSLPAQQAFIGAQAAVRVWDLPGADSSLAAALRFDAGYAEAALWLGLTRWWARHPTPLWQASVEQALAGTARLSARQREMAADLATLARGATVAACEGLGRLARADRHDFAAWYAWAVCLKRDTIVVRDARSPSGWRFRSSYQQALAAYRQAMISLPSMHHALENDADVRSVLVITRNQIRWARAEAPDTTAFIAYPALQGDTLLFLPYPAADVQMARRHRVPSIDQAVWRQQQVFHQVASSWAAEFPTSVDAVAALALSLEMLRDPSCLDTLRRARALARTPDDRVRLAVTEVWTRLKFALPGDTAGIRLARALADSLVGHAPPDATTRESLAALMVLLGRPSLVSGAYGVSADGPGTHDLATLGAALVAYASLGGPPDSLASLLARVERLTAAIADPVERENSRIGYASRASDLAFPVLRRRLASATADSIWPLAAAEDALARGDTAAVRRELAMLAEFRRGAAPGATSIDGLYPEAWLILETGDPAGAARWLDETLAALPTTSPGDFDDAARAGALVRAMALRAELAQRLGDRQGARRWARAVVLLWTGSEPFVQDVVRRMRALTDSIAEG